VDVLLEQLDQATHDLGRRRGWTFKKHATNFANTITIDVYLHAGLLPSLEVPGQVQLTHNCSGCCLSLINTFGTKVVCYLLDREHEISAVVSITGSFW